MGVGVHVVALYVIVLWLPGLLLGGLVGLRGWTLIASAPLLTYAAAGLAGPAFSGLHIAWSPVSVGVLMIALTVAVAALQWILTRRTRRLREEPLWSRGAQTAVAASAGAVAVFGGSVIWQGIGHLSAVPQDWDAAFHANGIRWIADTGDSSLFGMGHVNWFENGVSVFYPNAYHLVAAVVLRLTGADVPTVLNAHTVLLPGMGALVVVALVRRFRGRALHAVAAAACSVSFTAFYDMLWRGPLLPFVTGAVLMPLTAVLVVDLLDAEDLRSRIVRALLFAAGLVALISLNPAMLFTAVLFVLPVMVQRWAGRPGLLRREPLVLLGAGVVAGLLALPQVLGSLASADGEPPFDWPANLSQSEAVGELLTLSHDGLRPQWWLVVAAALGIARYGALARLRWVAAFGAAFGVLFVLTATSDAYWVNAVTRPWWNDQWRLIGLCVVPLAVLAGHGIAEAQRWVAGAVTPLTRTLPVRWSPSARTALSIVTAGLVLAFFVVASNNLYYERNVARMRLSAPDGPVVSSLEIDAMHVLADVVPPGQRVLNDRGDGSAWMYAIAGVLPVAGHYSSAQIGPDTQLLNDRFNHYPDDPAVRAAVRRLHVFYVMLGRGFVRSDWQRAPGLVGLENADWLEEIYQNRDAVIYRIRNDVPGRP